MNRLQTMMVWMAAALLATLMAVPTQAHIVGPPRDYEARLLHDCNDDYFGQDEVIDKDGYEVHTLDVSERRIAGIGDALVFRVVYNGGYAGNDRPELRIAVTWTGPGGEKTHHFATNNGNTWTGNWDRILGPTDKTTRDGQIDRDRFALEGVISYNKAGVKIGDKIRDYRVVSSIDGTAVDTIPGDDTGPLRECTDNTRRPDYTIRGTSYHIGITLEPAESTVQVGQEKFINVRLENPFRHHAQSMQINLAGGGNDIDARFHDPNGGYSNSLTKDLPKDGSNLIHLAITGKNPGSQGTLTVKVSSDLGGYIEKTFQYRVAEAGSSDPGTNPPNPPGNDPGEPTGDKGKDSPGPAPLVLALALVGVALMLRRRQ